jgi:hypothetical protein
LLKIKAFFDQVGTITVKDNYVSYNVYSIDDILRKIIPHFNKYPLLTQKYVDFFVFKQIIEIIDKKEHLDKDGILKIISLKNSLNKGLPDKIKNTFPNLIKVERFVHSSVGINSHWFAGFFSGEGCFYIDISKSKCTKSGYSVSLKITLDQHIRDEFLIKNFIEFLSCGQTFISSRRNIINYKVSKFEDINMKIIPFFKKYPIEGVKALDFENFCESAKLIYLKLHLTDKGLDKIRNLKIRRNINNKKIN